MTLITPNPCYEIEIRGPLSVRARSELVRVLNERGAELKSERARRESYIFEAVKDGSLDLRLRKAESGPELVLKRGPQRLAIARWKHTVGLRQDVDFKELLEFFAHYGYKAGRVVRRDYTTYTWSPWSAAYSFKIVLAEVPDFEEYNYFEIERAVADREMIGPAVDQVHRVATELGLTCWSSEEYAVYLGDLKQVDRRYEWIPKHEVSFDGVLDQFPLLGLKSGLGGD